MSAVYWNDEIGSWWSREDDEFIAEIERYLAESDE